MKQHNRVIEPGSTFRHVFILESRDWWPAAVVDYDPVQDLVLTYDFGLRRDVESLGGATRYIDNLCEPSVMEENNFRMYKFFSNWHVDAHGTDIFRYREVDFGFSFRLEFWNDFTFYIRNRLCLEQLRSIVYMTLYVGTSDALIEEIVQDMQLEYIVLCRGEQLSRGNYFFPIHRWMDERLRIRKMRHVARDILISTLGRAMSQYDRFIEYFYPKKRIFVQEYHPTRKLLQSLQRQPGIKVVQVSYSATRSVNTFLRDRPIPVYGSATRYKTSAASLLDAFNHRRTERLVLSNGVDVTDAVNLVIERRVAAILPEWLRTLDCVIRYIDNHPIRLLVLIGNVGKVATLVDCVSKCRDIPSYLIINGLLANDFSDEGKFATVINAYGVSIGSHYFRGMENIVCLGDPRMDDYSRDPAKTINRISPTLTIGASGFSPIDLNSYLAVEFEFLSEVLTAIENLTKQGIRFRVILKVRANSYSDLYRHFIDEYFDGLIDKIIDNIPIRAVLDETDLYLSIYSQSLFEASSLGIPCIYHKNDQQIMHPPFDGNAELVTTYDVLTLEQALCDFLFKPERYDSFNDRSVMEKYIGPLDGGNLERNLLLIDEMLANSRRRRDT